MTASGEPLDRDRLRLSGSSNINEPDPQQPLPGGGLGQHDFRGLQLVRLVVNLERVPHELLRLAEDPRRRTVRDAQSPFGKNAKFSCGAGPCVRG
jgi:hypothetical protein